MWTCVSVYCLEQAVMPVPAWSSKWACKVPAVAPEKPTIHSHHAMYQQIGLWKKWNYTSTNRAEEGGCSHLIRLHLNCDGVSKHIAECVALLSKDVIHNVRKLLCHRHQIKMRTKTLKIPECTVACSLSINYSKPLTYFAYIGRKKCDEVRVFTKCGIWVYAVCTQSWP